MKSSDKLQLIKFKIASKSVVKLHLRWTTTHKCVGHSVAAQVTFLLAGSPSFTPTKHSFSYTKPTKQIQNKHMVAPL